MTQLSDKRLMPSATGYCEFLNWTSQLTALIIILLFVLHKVQVSSISCDHNQGVFIPFTSQVSKLQHPKWSTHNFFFNKTLTHWEYTHPTTISFHRCQRHLGRPLLQRHQVHQVPVTADLPRLLRVFWYRPPGRRNRWMLQPWQLGCFHFNRFKTWCFSDFRRMGKWFRSSDVFVVVP